MLALIPLTPGGLGFVEAGLVGTLTLAGVPGSDALAATLLYRLVSYWLPLPAGGVRSRMWPLPAEIPHAVRRLADSFRRGGRRQSDCQDEQSGGTSMESMLDRASQMAGTQLTKLRWALGLNGALSIAAGVVILVWPDISLFALTILFGAWVAATGVVGLVAALSGNTDAVARLACSLEPARHRRRCGRAACGRTSPSSRCST